MKDVINRARKHCEHLILKGRCSSFPFHNIGHTLRVHKHALIIGSKEGLSDFEKTIIELAAYFHDTGYSEVYQGHELISATQAVLFLEGEGVSADIILKVAGCIRATQFPQRPKSILEEIICDADLAHLASPSYVDNSKRLRKEWAVYLNKTFTDPEWKELNIKFLQSHSYFTDYAKTVLAPAQKRNIEILKA